jgi:hypothetical protein
LRARQRYVMPRENGSPGSPWGRVAATAGIGSARERHASRVVSAIIRPLGGSGADVQAWRRKRHVVSSLEASDFDEEGLRAAKGTSMRKISEVLRLAGQGLSYRQIGQSVGISPSTAHGYLERARRAGPSWPLPDDVDEVALHERLFKRRQEELRPGRPKPDWLEVHRERKAGKHVTLQLLHLEHKQAHPGGLSELHPVLCASRRWLGRQRRGHAPGGRGGRAHVRGLLRRYTRSPTPTRASSGRRPCLRAC